MHKDELNHFTNMGTDALKGGSLKTSRDNMKYTTATIKIKKDKEERNSVFNFIIKCVRVGTGI